MTWWTTGQVRMLKESGGKVSAKELAIRLGHTEAAVRVKAARLGVQLGRYYDYDEVERLARSGLKRREAAKELGRSSKDLGSSVYHTYGCYWNELVRRMQDGVPCPRRGA